MKAVYRLFYYISILLTFALAGFTLTGAFTCQAVEGRTALVSFLGLALPILLLINLAVAIYWTIRWRYWVFVPLIAILGNWGYLSRIFQFHSTPETSQEVGLLTVATYNVDSFGLDESGSSCKDIAGYMKGQQADILCFQEFSGNKYFTVDSVKAAFGDWKYCSIPQAPSDSIPILQIAVFSKYPIKSTQLITYPDSRNCSMRCDIEVNGRTIRLFNNHLQTTEVSRNKRKLEKELRKDVVGASEKAVINLADGLHENFIKRDAQADVMSKLINASPYPSLVCGDFNSIPSSYTYHTMKGEKLKDGFQECGHGYMYTFRYFKHLLRIDYIFHTSEFKGVDYFSPNLEYSDHNPVVMKMKY